MRVLAFSATGLLEFQLMLQAHYTATFPRNGILSTYCSNIVLLENVRALAHNNRGRYRLSKAKVGSGISVTAPSSIVSQITWS